MALAVRWTVSRKLVLLGGTGLLVAGVMAVSGLLGVDSIRSANSQAAALTTAFERLTRADVAQERAREALMASLLATDDAGRKDATAGLTEAKQLVRESWDAIAALDLPADVRSAITALRDAYATYLNETAAQMAKGAILNPASPASQQIFSESASLGDAVDVKIAAAKDLLERRTGAAHAAAASDAFRSRSAWARETAAAWANSSLAMSTRRNRNACLFCSFA